mgnify:FL=1
MLALTNNLKNIIMLTKTNKKEKYYDIKVFRGISKNNIHIKKTK